MVQTVQKRLVQKKLHFCLICGLIQRVGNFSLQLLSISLLFSECLTYHTVRYLGENNGGILLSCDYTYTSIQMWFHHERQFLSLLYILKVLCAILRLQRITTGALRCSFDFTSSSQQQSKRTQNPIPKLLLLWFHFALLMDYMASLGLVLDDDGVLE